MAVTYQPSLTTIEQLKSSGNLRLIEDKNIANKIMGYATFVQNNIEHSRINDMNDAANTIYVMRKGMLLLMKHFSKKIDDVE
jgi:ribosomal protein S17E